MGKSKKFSPGPRDDYFDDLYDDYDDDSMDDDMDEDDGDEKTLLYDEFEDGLEEVDLDDMEDEDLDSMEEEDEFYDGDIYPEDHEEEEEADDEYSEARRDIWSDMDWDKD